MRKSNKWVTQLANDGYTKKPAQLSQNLSVVEDNGVTTCKDLCRDTKRKLRDDKSAHYLGVRTLESLTLKRTKYKKNSNPFILGLNEGTSSAKLDMGKNSQQ